MHLLLTSASLVLVIAIQTAESADPVCEEPSQIEYASITKKNDIYTVGTNVTYVCQFGYVASGKSRKRWCIRSGDEAKWTDPEFSCRPQSCGDPGFVTNGERVGSLFTFPNSVTYHCDTGYTIRGIPTRYCQTSGTWSGRLPVCEVVKCDPPENPENGHVTVSSLDYGSELSYRCDTGFSLSTSDTVYCTEEGSWSRSNITCIETLCEILEKPQYGNMRFRGSEQRARAGSIAIFTCEDGRVPSGPTTSKCLENGVWTFPPPECLEPCTVRYVSNGAIGEYVREGFAIKKSFKQIPTGTRVEEDVEFHLNCLKGFEAPASRQRETKIFCSKGMWSFQPLCEPASCKKAPPYAANATAVNPYANPEHNSRVLYDCLTDYKKVTSETIVCDHGEWKGTPPTCKSTKCSVNTLTSGILKGPKYIYRDGEILEVTCDRRYRLAEGHNGQIVCEEGIWNGDLSPCAPVNCSHHPPSIENGRVKDSFNMVHGFVVKYVCDDPYVLVDRGPVQCAYGEWTGELPSCSDNRCFLKDLRNLNDVSSESPSFTFSGDRLNIICKYGYTPESTMPVCRSGKWDRSYLSLCKESDCQIPNFYGGKVVEKIYGNKYWSYWYGRYIQEVSHIKIPTGTIIRSGKILWLTCHNPYTVLGQGKYETQIRCSKGKWSTDLLCLKDGEQIPPTAETSLKRYTSTMEPPRSTSTTTTKHIPPTTTSGTLDVGSPPPGNEKKEEFHTVATTNAPTEPVVEECFCKYPIEDSKIVAYADGKQLIYGDKVRNGSVVEFRCLQVGYDRFRGLRAITCSNCQPWHSANFPECVAPKKGDAVILLDNSFNVLANGDIELHKGDDVVVKCATMEMSIYPDWSAPKVPGISSSRYRRDREEQGDVVYFTFLEIQNATYEHEGIYECSVNDKRKTRIRITVTDPNLRCPEIPEEDNIDVEYERERQEGSRAFFSCPKKGQELIGQPDLTCLKKGEWSDTPPQCSDIRCEKLKITNLLQIDYSKDREVGSYAAFHCTFPGKRSGASFTTCLANRTWTLPTPDCIVPNCAVDELVSNLPNDVVLASDIKENRFLPYNSIVKLTCDNKIIKGNPEAKCGNESKWEIGPVECDLNCNAPEVLPDSNLKFSPEKELYAFGDRVVFSCPPGMNLTGKAEAMMCLSNGWSATIIPSCKGNED